MKIWSDTLSRAHMYAAARKANVDIAREIENPARKRAFRWDISLAGDSPHYSSAAGDMAATWDQWGIFLNTLFEFDPDMTTGYYTDKAEFDKITGYRFETLTFEESHRRHKWHNAGLFTWTCECGATWYQMRQKAQMAKELAT